MSLTPACRGWPSACHRNLPLALGVVCWWDHSAVKVILLLKVGCLPIFLLILTRYTKKVCVCLWRTCYWDVNVLTWEISCVDCHGGYHSSSQKLIPEQPTQAKCLVLWSKIWNLSHSLSNWSVGVWWEELLVRSGWFRNPIWKCRGHQRQEFFRFLTKQRGKKFDFWKLEDSGFWILWILPLNNPIPHTGRQKCKTREEKVKSKITSFFYQVTFTKMKNFYKNWFCLTDHFDLIIVFIFQWQVIYCFLFSSLCGPRPY